MAAKKTVKRITLSGGKKTIDNGPVEKQVAISEPKKSQTRSFSLVAILMAPPRYFKNSWQELREVRWPNRSATWGLTVAVILFTVFFAVIILLLDAGFQFLFKQVLLK